MRAFPTASGSFGTPAAHSPGAMEQLPIEDGCVRPEIRELREDEWPAPPEKDPKVVYELVF